MVGELLRRAHPTYHYVQYIFRKGLQSLLLDFTMGKSQWIIVMGTAMYVSTMHIQPLTISKCP